MKRTLFCLAMLLAASSLTLGQGATNWNIYSKPTADWWTGNSKDIAWRWGMAMDRNAATAGSVQMGTGNVYYVDSGVTNAGDGSSWSNAFATWDEAYASCTSNNGDVIKIREGHAETWSTAAMGVTVDKIGVQVIGYGEGTNAPTFTYTHADATIDITVANWSFRNLRFVSGVSAVVSSITLAAGADYGTISGCEWVTPTTGTWEFYDMITLATGSDFITISGNKFCSLVATTGCNQAINGDAGIVNRLSIIGNEFQGTFTVAAVHSDKVNTNMLVAGNVVHQATAGQFGLEFTDAATGILADNYVYTNAVATAIDPGSLAPFNNLIINTVDLSAYVFPPLPAIGTVTAGSAEDILKKLYYGTDGTGAYPATLANDSALAMIMAKGATATPSTFSNTTDSLEAIRDAIDALGLSSLSAIGDKVVADMDANSVDTAILNDLGGLSEVGDKVVADMDANSTSLDVLTDLGGISEVGDKVVADMDANSTLATNVTANKAILDDLAGISQIGDKVQADMDANSVLYWQERTAYTTADEVTSDLFTVAGGPILITSMVGYIDVVVGATPTTAKLWIDTTAGASYDQDFSTAVSIVDDAVGTTYVFSNANPSVLTPLTPGSAGATTLMTPWFCPVGTVEQLMSADPGGAGGDHITWYMTWKPLKAGITVTGVSP